MWRWNNRERYWWKWDGLFIEQISEVADAFGSLQSWIAQHASFGESVLSHPATKFEALGVYLHYELQFRKSKTISKDIAKSYRKSAIRRTMFLDSFDQLQEADLEKPFLILNSFNLVDFWYPWKPCFTINNLEAWNQNTEKLAWNSNSKISIQHCFSKI